MRLRHRPNQFIWHGDVFAFHRHQDGATLSRLDPYCAEAQSWPLNSGRVIEVTGEEVRDITLQVHGIELPATRPTGEWNEARIAALEARLAELEARQTVDEPATSTAEPEPAPEPQPDPRDAELDAMRAEIDALRAAKRELEERELELKDANASLKDALSDIEDRIADLDDEDEYKFPAPDERPPLDSEAEAALTTDHLLAASDEAASDVISKLSREGRRRFTELLNVELAELQQNRDGPHEDRKREAKIERLLGIFARAGEM